MHSAVLLVFRHRSTRKRKLLSSTLSVGLFLREVNKRGSTRGNKSQEQEEEEEEAVEEEEEAAPCWCLKLYANKETNKREHKAAAAALGASL